MMETLLFIFLIGISMENTNAEPMFQLHSPAVLSIDGNAVKALKVACDEFESSGNDIRRFIVTISLPEKNADIKGSAADLFTITFMGRLAPGKRGLGTANRVPGSVTYFISKDDWKIIKKQWIK